MTNSSVEFTVDLSFNSFYNIASICNDNVQIHDGQKYWFSWNFNGKTYKSDEFTRHENGPPRLRHIEDFEIDCRPDGLLPRSIIQLFPLKVFFCTNQSILAITTFHPFKVDSVEEENIMSIVPFQISEWVEIKPIEDPSISSILYDPASMEISLKISIKSSITNDDIYEDDQFDEEESAIKHYDAHVDKEVHFDVGLEAERSHYVTNDSSSSSSSNNNTIMQVSTLVHQKQKQTQSGEERKKALLKMREDELEDDRKLRHYRLSIDLRSLGGLKRPAHVSLQYIYPYLGTSSPVRTSPKWMMAHTEAKIDGGAASFECVLSREQLRSTLTTHPLKVTALTKSHLGNNILGELNIDLVSVMCTEPHSYRCPLTGKSFRSLKEYSKHRQILLTLLAAGRVQQAPQKDPIVIKAIDSYLVLTHPSSSNSNSSGRSDAKNGSNYIVPLAEGAKLRVVLILEEIGVVGIESGVQVKPGYKMHNGALYDMYGVSSVVSVGLPPQGSSSSSSSSISISNNNMKDVDVQAQIANDNDNEGDAEEEDNDDANCDERVDNMAGIHDHARIDDRLGSDPTMRSDMTPHERKHLEKLKLDWEAWRRTVDGEWREAMAEKEALLKKKLEADASLKLVERAEDLKRAQIEAGKLEIRLRGSIEEVERQKAQLTLKEEQMQLRLAQKASELQLLQRRVRDEAKALVQAETRKNESVLQQLASSQQSYMLMEKRAKDAEHDFDVYRAQLRNAPESVLREETARLKAQLGECRAEIERERRLRSETEVEKEHFRSQMHRLALALKREREKSSSMARQELEELRLEFLAREERYILDGDREELRSIRNDLAALKFQNNSNSSSNNSIVSSEHQHHQQLPSSSMRSMERTTVPLPQAQVLKRSDDDGSMESKESPSSSSSSSLDSNRRKASTNGTSSTRRSNSGVHFTITSPTTTNRANGLSNNDDNNNIYNTYTTTTTTEVSSYRNGEILVQLIESLKDEIKDLLATGMYEEDGDTLILELKRKLVEAEEQLSMLSIVPL